MNSTNLNLEIKISQHRLVSMLISEKLKAQTVSHFSFFRGARGIVVAISTNGLTDFGLTRRMPPPSQDILPFNQEATFY